MSTPPSEEVQEASSGSLARRAAHLMQRQARLVIGLLLGATGAMVLPFLLMAPTSNASQEPAGKLFAARDLAAERFAPRAHRMVFIIEDRDGNILRPGPLQELLANSRALRADPQVGPKLLSYPLPGTGAPAKGMFTVADALASQLDALAKSHSAEAKARFAASLDQLVEARGPAILGLSAKARRDPDSGRWSAPALVVPVLADNNALGGGSTSAVLGARSTHKESFAREVQRLLRGGQRHLGVWGLAIDVNLTSQEQGRAAGPFIGLTIFAILLLVGVVHRSYWSVAVVGFCLGCLIIWLKGLSHLIGLKHDQILSTIVPVAMISFGVDYAFHSLGRYREALFGGASPRRALTLGLGSGLAALLLATVTDATAFLANASSGIESLIQFGVAAALATFSSLLVLGLLAPLLLMKLSGRDRLRGRPRLGLALGVGGSLLASLGAMAVVILAVFILPWAGAAALGGYGLLFLLAPWALGLRSDPDRPRARGEERRGEWRLIGRAIEGLARRRRILLPAVLLLTAVSGLLATRVQPEFDVKDFFAADTDFVVALDKFDAHVGARGGEPAVVYVEGQLLTPAALDHLRRFIDQIRALKTDRLARDAEGRVQLSPGLLRILAAARGLPDSPDRPDQAGNARQGGQSHGDGPAATAALLHTARLRGLTGPGNRTVMSADMARSLFWENEEGTRQATLITLRIPGSRTPKNIQRVRQQLEPLVLRLEQSLQQITPSATATLTGEPITRQASLDAILRAFRLSLPVAILLCFALTALFMRSLRLAVISVLPILMVVTWLYALMYLGGVGVNVVTATIGAISIGQGIDFAVHLTMRYREELQGGRAPQEALRLAGSGTGGALSASAISSITGFSILGLSPMPMFAAFGLLTALMVLLAAVASLCVLPSLLMIGAPRPRSG